MKLSFFEWMVLGGIYGAVFFMGVGLQSIYRRLGEILDEITGEAQETRDEASFYDRPNRRKEQR